MASLEVASQATNVKRKKRKRRMDEFEIDWIPEDTGAPYEADDVFLIYQHTRLINFVKQSLDTPTGPGWDRCHQRNWSVIPTSLTTKTG